MSTIDPKKDCRSCPWFQSTGQTTNLLRKDINSAVCGLHHHVLTIIDPRTMRVNTDASRQLREYRAERCPDYGTSASPDKLRLLRRSTNLQVVLPNPTMRVDTPDGPFKDGVSSCMNCSKYVKPSVVADKLGYYGGLCSAKGNLITPENAGINAQNCQFRSFGANLDTIEGMHPLPELSQFLAPSVTKAFMPVGSYVEPTEYKTDRDVSEDDKNQGIRAWRRVSDPEDDQRVVHLPIYRTDYFTPEQQALIPRSGEEAHPEQYVDHFGGMYLAAVCWSELDETPALWGEPGTGKTELFRHLAWAMNLPFHRISITASTELEDLAGKMHFDPAKGTYFTYGRLPSAWTRPGVICLDEPNTGPADVWQFLRPLTDNSKQLVLDMNNGEALDRHADSYMGLAMNPAWDAKNIGAQMIGDADANRLFHVQVPLPPEAIEKAIIAARVKLDGWELTTDQFKMLMGVAADLRKMTEDGSLAVTWAIRPQIKVARALRWFDPVTAYRRAIADFLEPEAARMVLDAVNSHTK